MASHDHEGFPCALALNEAGKLETVIPLGEGEGCNIACLLNMDGAFLLSGTVEAP